jgi:hypothetical protein
MYMTSLFLFIETPFRVYLLPAKLCTSKSLEGNLFCGLHPLLAPLLVV